MCTQVIILITVDNLKTIAKYPKPSTYTTIKGFVGLIRHYRHFIKDFVWISDPLHEYTRGDSAKEKERVVLNEAARDAFHKLKKAVMTAPVLTYPDPNKEYLLKTDASKLRLGAVLSQKQQDGRCHPIAFRGRELHGAEVPLPQYKTGVLGHEVVHRAFSYLLVGSSLQSQH